MSDRNLYKISYLTNELGVSPRTIRYYDQYGLLPHIKRSEGNVRLFDDSDIELIKKIRKLQKEDLMSLDEIKKQLFGERIDQVYLRRKIITESSVNFGTIKESLKNLTNLSVVDYQLKLASKQVDPDSLSVEKNIWSIKEKCQNQIEEVYPKPEAFEALIEQSIQEELDDIYIVSSSLEKTNYFKSLEQLCKKKQAKSRLHLIDTQALNLGLNLFVYLLLMAFQNNLSNTEIDVLIHKYAQKNKTFIIPSNLGFLFSLMDEQLQKDSRRNTLKCLKALHPVLSFESNKKNLDLIGCFFDVELATEKVIELFQEYFEENRRSASFISIHYTSNKTMAEKLKEHIHKIYQQVPIDLAPMPMNAIANYGPESLSVSII